MAPPTDASVYASSGASRCRLQDSRPGWIRYFLSCRALASPTTCRFIPALSELPVIHRSADHNLLRSGGQVIGTRVMLTATQEPRPDPRLLQDRGSWPALSSR